MEAKPILRTRYRRSSERRDGNSTTTMQGSRVADRRQRSIDASALFRGIEPHPVDELIGDCEVLAVPAGTALLKPGEANDSVYLLLSGRLATLIDSNQTVENGIPIHPGESVGEMSAIDGKPVSALVITTTDSRILRLPADMFWNRLSVIPGVARNLLAALTERMRRSNESMLEAQRKQLALEYLQQELAVARQLQSSMLPQPGPMFVDRHDLDVEGLMEPASEIGGDLFDAFFVDDRRLFFCIGDVSGHGIPAALFMARTIGLMRVSAMTIDAPGRLLMHVNDQLSEGNDANIFVTLFCGFLDVTNGRLIYSNGGHLAPLRIETGCVEPLPLPKGPLVGAISGLTYSDLETILEPSSSLLCFTDGVTEACNREGTEYGEQRLANHAGAFYSSKVGDLLRFVRSDVADFTKKGQLDDDCTMLAVRRI